MRSVCYHSDDVLDDWLVPRPDATGVLRVNACRYIIYRVNRVKCGDQQQCCVPRWVCSRVNRESRSRPLLAANFRIAILFNDLVINWISRQISTRSRYRETRFIESSVDVINNKSDRIGHSYRFSSEEKSSANSSRNKCLLPTPDISRGTLYIMYMIYINIYDAWDMYM